MQTYTRTYIHGYIHTCINTYVFSSSRGSKRVDRLANVAASFDTGTSVGAWTTAVLFERVCSCFSTSRVPSSNLLLFLNILESPSSARVSEVIWFLSSGLLHFSLDCSGPFEKLAPVSQTLWFLSGGLLLCLRNFSSFRAASGAVLLHRVQTDMLMCKDRGDLAPPQDKIM